MATHDEHLPTTVTNVAARPSAPVPHAHHDGVRDTVPVIVWRTSPDEPDATSDIGGGDSPLTSHLAHYLVAVYSDVNCTVVDLDADDYLRHAAKSNGHRYLTVDSSVALTAATGWPPMAALIFLRSPPPAAATSSEEANRLLGACQQRLEAAGIIIVIVRTAASGDAGPTYIEHEQVLLQAAQGAGLRHLHDIVPLDATDDRDTFTYATGHDNDTHSLRQTTHTTLMVFAHPETARVTPGDSRDRSPDAVRQSRLRRPGASDTPIHAGDRHVTPHDWADKPNHPSNESGYGASASPETDHDLDPERTSDPCQPSSPPERRLRRSVATGPLPPSGTSGSAVRP